MFFHRGHVRGDRAWADGKVSQLVHDLDLKIMVRHSLIPFSLAANLQACKEAGEGGCRRGGDGRVRRDRADETKQADENNKCENGGFGVHGMGSWDDMIAA